MVQMPTKPLTLEEFMKLPETEPASEYIDGQIIQKPMPQGKHSVIQGESVTAINAVVKPQKIARVFQNYGVPSEGGQLYLMCLYLFGIEFPAMRVAQLLTFFKRLLIG